MKHLHKTIAAALVLAGLLGAPVAPAFAQDSNNTIILEMGRASSDDLQDLRMGEGRVFNRIERVVEDLKEQGQVSSDAQVVIVIVKQR